jgi:heat shock protein HslJ
MTGAKMLRPRPLLQVIPAAIALVVFLGCAGEVRQGRRMQAGSTAEPTRMAGLYEYLADAAWFSDCASGKRAPVAMEADNAALEQAYLEVREEPGEAVLVTLEGRTDQRPSQEGEGTREHLIVERFEQIWPGESCERSTVQTPLENTYWKLVELRGAPVEAHPDQREIHLRLRPEEERMTGFAGCNQFMGGYEITGNSLAFGPLGSTMMACPYLDDETAFLRSLEGVTRFQILGESLVLSDDTGDLARFRAVYFE